MAKVNEVTTAQEQQQVEAVYRELQEYGCSRAEAERIYREWMPQVEAAWESVT